MNDTTTFLEELVDELCGHRRIMDAAAGKTPDSWLSGYKFAMDLAIELAEKARDAELA